MNDKMALSGELVRKKSPYFAKERPPVPYGDIPKEFMRQATLQAQVDLVCEDLKAGAMPTEDLWALAVLLGVPFEATEDQSTMCSRVRQALYAHWESLNVRTIFK